jgi:hypothetical protein
MKNITDFQEAYEVRHGKEIKHMGEYVLFCITN